MRAHHIPRPRRRSQLIKDKTRRNLYQKLTRSESVLITRDAKKGNRGIRCPGRDPKGDETEGNFGRWQLEKQTFEPF